MCFAYCSFTWMFEFYNFFVCVGKPYQKQIITPYYSKYTVYQIYKNNTPCFLFILLILMQCFVKCYFFLIWAGTNWCSKFRLTLGCVPKCMLGSHYWLTLVFQKCLPYPTIQKNVWQSEMGRGRERERRSGVNYVCTDERQLRFVYNYCFSIWRAL